MSSIPVSDRPTIFGGTPVYCELCAGEELTSFRKVDDLRLIPCPCGRHYDDGTPYGARFIDTAPPAEELEPIAQTYRDHPITVEHRPGNPDGILYRERQDRVEATIDGKLALTQSLHGDEDTDLATIAAKLLAKARATVDRSIEDADITPTLVNELAFFYDTETDVEAAGWVFGTPVKIGDRAVTYSRGKFRPGIVTHVTRTGRATIAYTTPSNAGHLTRVTAKPEHVAAKP